LSVQFICSFVQWVVNSERLVFWTPCIFWLLIPHQIHNWLRFFSHFVGCLFSLLFPLPCRSFLLSCSPICQYFLNCWAIGILFKKLLPMPIWSNVFPIFSWISFTISDLSSFWIDASTRLEIGIQGQSSAGGNPVFPVPFIEESVFSPMHSLGTFAKNQMAVVVWVFVRVFCSIPLVFRSGFFFWQQKFTKAWIFFSVFCFISLECHDDHWTICFKKIGKRFPVFIFK
jgi:hypothetical protein